jgi:quinol monooxygenase YgiN
MDTAAEVVFYPQRSSATDAKEVLAKSANAWRKHSGFVAAYYGPLVEDRKICCLVLEWKDKDSLIGWTRNYNAQEVDEGKAKLIDSEAGLDPFASM